ncbi:MipA/OmpV family protein [Ahrensia kielensis]|uniref:MipA/OmpV family protein n=1 Tax=Ahrensia kielensis TaxID=76980 RepID=A0ABU9T6I0_9HYPH
MNKATVTAIVGSCAASFVGVSPSTAQESNLFSNVSLAAGGFVSVAPVYEGSNKYRVSAFPIAYPTFGDGNGERSRLTFRGIDDVRYAAFRKGSFDLGPVVGYNFGRKESLSTDLNGLGDVDGGVVAGAFAAYTVDGFSVDAAVSKQFTGLDDSGFLARFGAGYETAVTDSLTLSLYTGTTYASDDYMDNMFGVSSAQNAESGLSVFNAGAGFKNIDVKAAASYQASEQLNLRANVGYSKLIGDAADSPISVTNDQFSGGLGFIYQF